MAAGVLAAAVYVHDENGTTFYDRGQDVAPEHVALIGAHCWEGGEAPEGTPATPDGERPGGNASRPTWAAYAAAQGISVPESATRADIIAAVDTALAAAEAKAAEAEAAKAAEAKAEAEAEAQTEGKGATPES